MTMHSAPWLAFGLSAAVLAVVAVLWTEPDPPAKPIVHVAASLRPAMEKAAAAFEADTGIRVELRFGPSEKLVSDLKLTGQGDLLIPADDSYVADARKAHLVDDEYDLASMKAVFLVRPGKEPKTWDDVLAKSFRLVQPSLEATAVGKLTRAKLVEAGLWSKIDRKKPPSAGTVTDAANAVKLGSADGAVVWDAVAAQYPDLKSVRLPHLDQVKARVTAAMCRGALARKEARRFAEYLVDPEGGQAHFREAGFAPPMTARVVRPGDGSDEIVLFAGAMLRPAIEETIKEFEEREDVTVKRVYNGCGILVSQMRTDGGRPDVFLSCDARFMDDVADLFHRPEVISNNQLVIAVPKGNPRGIAGLRDLGQVGLKVGVGHESQCALGALTQETFIKTGVFAAVEKNIVVRLPTGDMLINELLIGSLDAIVCYTSNVAINPDKVDAIPITGIACAAPDQPVAIAKGSANPELAARLIEAIRSRESRERFEKLGFGWGSKGPRK